MRPSGLRGHSSGGRVVVLPPEVEGARVTGPEHSPFTPPTYSAGRAVVIPEGRLLTASGGKPEASGQSSGDRVAGWDYGENGNTQGSWRRGGSCRPRGVRGSGYQVLATLFFG